MAAPKQEPVDLTGRNEGPEQTAAGHDGSWDSELSLADALSKLQDLDRHIHQLRTLLPHRLLAPIVPLISPQMGAVPSPSPSSSLSPLSPVESPQMLGEQLQVSARNGAAEVDRFQALWRSPEMQRVWAHVESLVKDNDGQLLQPTGTWERDYRAVFEELVGAEEQRQLQLRSQAEQAAQSQAGAAPAAHWQSVVDGFLERKRARAVRIVPLGDGPDMRVVLVRAGLAFQVSSSTDALHRQALDWRVERCPTAAAQPMSKFERAVVSCLNDRPRKWDLAYLLVRSSPEMKDRKTGTDASQD